jgi:hypothetical protein
VSRINVTVGTATVDIGTQEFGTASGAIYGSPYRPQDLINATIKALRAIDTDEANRLADGIGQMPVSGVSS